MAGGVRDKGQVVVVMTETVNITNPTEEVIAATTTVSMNNKVPIMAVGFLV